MQPNMQQYPQNQMPPQMPQNNIFMPPSPGQSPHPMIDQDPDKKPVGLIIGLVVFLLLTITFAVLSVLFYGQMSDYKNNSDKKSAVAVESAKKEQEKQLTEQFAEQSKEPLVSYKGPASAASVDIDYPKTWNMYVIEGKSGTSVQAYFNPNSVADVSNKDNVYALRLEVLDRAYESVIKEYDAKAKKGDVTVTPYKPELVENAEVGVRITGTIRDDKVGTMVILPVRDKTIKLWTESGNYTKDFDAFILKNLQYSP